MPTSGGKPKTCKLIEGFKGHPPHFVGSKQVPEDDQDGTPSVFLLALPLGIRAKLVHN